MTATLTDAFGFHLLGSVVSTLRTVHAENMSAFAQGWTRSNALLCPHASDVAHSFVHCHDQ